MATLQFDREGEAGLGLFSWKNYFQAVNERNDDARIEQEDLQARTSDIVIFETVFTLQRSYKRTRAAIASGLLPLIELSGVHLPGKRMYRRVFELYLQTSLGFADCYHVALMEGLELTEILSFDMDFDHIPGVTRREE